MARRPNIVLITADQHRGDCFGFEGRNVKTPNLDLMAREGTRYSACITPNPVCQPARASMLTGLLPLTHGVLDNGFELDRSFDEVSFSTVLARAGYETGFIGKAHLSNNDAFESTGSPENKHDQKNYDASWHGPYKGFRHVQLVVLGHNRSAPPRPPNGQHYERWYYGDGRGEEKNRLLLRDLGPSTNEPQTWFSALPSAWHNTQWITDRSIEYIKNNLEKAFCLWVSYPDPHVPFDCPEPWSRLHRPDEVDLPPVRTMNFERRPWWYEPSMDAGWSSSNDDYGRKWRSQYSRRAPDDDDLRALISNYYGMISFIDYGVGRIRTTLDELGLADNTLVIYTSDHGEWLGDHGLLLKGPMLFDGLLRVGLILCGPKIPKNHMVASPVSTLDLPETFYDYCSIGNTPKNHSISLMNGLLRKGPERLYAVNEWNLQQSPLYKEALDLRTVHDGRHRLTIDTISGAGELYDLERDPHEEINVFDDASYSAVRGKLEQALHERPKDKMSPLPRASGYS